MMSPAATIHDDSVTCCACACFFCCDYCNSYCPHGDSTLMSHACFQFCNTVNLSSMIRCCPLQAALPKRCILPPRLSSYMSAACRDRCDGRPFRLSNRKLSVATCNCSFFDYIYVRTWCSHVDRIINDACSWCCDPVQRPTEMKSAMSALKSVYG